MKLTFLGTGAAFTVGDGNYHSNMVLESDSHKKLLIDCGTDVRLSIYEQSIPVRDLEDVYISHLHADHMGGLEWLAFTSKYSPQGSYKATLHLSHDLVEDLWNRALSAGLNPSKDPNIDLSTYFKIDEIPYNTFQWEGVNLHLVPTRHVVSHSWHMPCYGLWFLANGKRVLITGDTQFDLEGMSKFYDQSDIIFHDCETQINMSGVHAHYIQLKELDSQIKSKMWLYHYQPGPLPDAKKEGFKGFVRKGQCFDFNREECQ